MTIIIIILCSFVLVVIGGAALADWCARNVDWS